MTNISEQKPEVDIVEVKNIVKKFVQEEFSLIFVPK